MTIYQTVKCKMFSTAPPAIQFLQNDVQFMECDTCDTANCRLCTTSFALLSQAGLLCCYNIVFL